MKDTSGKNKKNKKKRTLLSPFPSDLPYEVLRIVYKTRRKNGSKYPNSSTNHQKSRVVWKLVFRPDNLQGRGKKGDS